MDGKRLRIKVWKERKELEGHARALQARVLEVQSEIAAAEKDVKGAMDRMNHTDAAAKSARSTEGDMQRQLLELKRKVCPLL